MFACHVRRRALGSLQSRLMMIMMLNTRHSTSLRSSFHATATTRDANNAEHQPQSAETNDNNNHNNNNNNDNDSSPPPIVWTTHRLTQEQIVKVDALFHKILWLDMIETALLTELINQRLGLKLTPSQRAALQKKMEARSQRGQQQQQQADEEQEQEEAAPKTVDLKLTGFDAKAKIKVIKEVRSIAGLGLKEAKEMVESAPQVIQKELKPEQAEELKQKLEQVGAQIELV